MGKGVCSKVSFTSQWNQEQMITMPKYGKVHATISKHARNRCVFSGDH